MTQEKKEKIFLASIALAVLILVLGVIILIFQGVEISNRKKELRAYERECAQLEQMIADGESEILILQQRETIIMLARKLGYVFPDEVIKDVNDLQTSNISDQKV